jgi:chitinase
MAKAGVAGSWDKVANCRANVFGGPISASQSVQWYISQGVPCHMIIQGSWESGVYDYRALPLPGSHILREERALASWTYNYGSKEMISFDDEAVGQWKGEYIAREGLGGSMFWELSGDKGGAPREGMEGGHGKEAQPGRSLERVVKEAMGGLDTAPN